MTMTRSELSELYNNNSNEYVCDKLKISMPTLLKLLKENGIENKGSGNRFNKSKIEIID